MDNEIYPLCVNLVLITYLFQNSWSERETTKKLNRSSPQEISYILHPCFVFKLIHIKYKHSQYQYLFTVCPMNIAEMALKDIAV